MLGKHDDLFRSTLQSGPVALRGLANATGTGNAVGFNAPTGCSSTRGCVRSASGLSSSR